MAVAPVLRDYQTCSVNAALDARLRGVLRPLIVLPTGAGKSLVLAEIARRVAADGGRVLIVTHVRELVEQDAAACDSIGLDVGIYSAGLDRRDIDHAVVVAGIQSAANNAGDFGKRDVLVVDECFTGETIISTPQGERRIDSLSPGDTIFCATGIGKVNSVFAKPSTDLLRIELSDDTEFTCTPDHPIFSEQGWADAKSLVAGSRIFCIQDMCGLWDNVQAKNVLEAKRKCISATKRKTVEQTAMLLSLLLQEMEKPNALRSVSPKNGKDTQAHRAQTKTTRREREEDSRSAIAAIRQTWLRLADGIRSFNRDKKGPGLCDLLQSGHRPRRKEDRYRGGRRVAWCPGKKGAGRKENINLGSIRVVRVSRVECQSHVPVYNLRVSGHPSYFANGILVHNCHRLRADGDGQYHQLIRGLREQNESITMIGLTATPYRTQSGMLTDGDPPLFDEVSYCAEIPDLISQGFLCPLRSKQAAQPSMAGVKVVAGDWSDGELGEVMAEHVAANCADLVKRAANCTRTLIFGCTIDHCQQIATALHVHGWAAPVITGSTPDAERDYLTRSIRSGEIRALINCQVLTTGFDAPGIDCVAIMRPTKSAGLYYQMAGRGFRIAEGKDFCTICDYGGNILRHGPLDRLRIKKNKGDMIGLAPMKACPECQEVLPLAARECLCGWVADPIEAKTAAVASEAPIIGVDEARELSVQTWQAIRHMSKAGTTTLRVDHEISFFKHISEWVCFEHTGYPRLKAEEWWLRHGGKNIPTTVDEALRRFGELRHPASIFVAKDGKYDRIMRRTFPRSETLR